MATEQEVIKKIERLYEINNLSKPKIIVCPSITNMYNYANILEYEQLIEQKYKPRHKTKSLYDINFSNKSSRDKFHYLINEPDLYKYQIISRCSYIDYDIINNILEKDFNYKINFKNPECRWSPKSYFNLCNNDNYYFISFNTICLISKPPVFLNIVNNQLHCTTDYAVYFEDKIGFYYVYGVWFDELTFKRFFINRTKETGLDSLQVLLISNNEQKAAVIKHIGYTKFMEGIKEYKTLDREQSKSKLDGKDIFYEVIEIEIPTTGIRHLMPLRMVKVTDFSTDKIVFLGVPSIEQTETCKGAVAWTFGIDTDKYNPLVET